MFVYCGTDVVELRAASHLVLFFCAFRFLGDNCENIKAHITAKYNTNGA